MMINFYTDPDENVRIKSSKFPELENEKKKSVMKAWFLERYEDPVHNQPIEDGGYEYPAGGPFDAHEELFSEFGNSVEEELIQELAKELEDDYSVYDWAYTTWYEERLGVYDDYEGIESVISLETAEPFEKLTERLNNLLKLLDEKERFDPALQKFQRMMVYSFSVTTLETFLWELFTKRVFQSDKTRKLFLENEPSFKDSKVKLSEILQHCSTLDKRLKDKILSTSFHNIARVKPLFEALGFELGDVEPVGKLVKKRHDFVHRSGNDSDGNEVDTTVSEITSCIEEIKRFSERLNSQFISMNEEIENVPF